MIDVRRAYRAWLKRRLLWLVPSFLLAVIVVVVLASDPDLSSWVRLPSLALASGVAILFGAIAVVTIGVVRERARGRGRRSQLLRAELRPSPGVGLALLVLLLALLAVPILFSDPAETATPRVHPRRPAPALVDRPSAEPVEVLPTEEPVAANPPPPPPPPEPAPSPQILPEIARIPELPLRLEDLELPVAPAVQENEKPGSDDYGFKHRPGDGDDLLGRLLDARMSFSRAGLPSESDLESWIPPEVKVELTLFSKSGPWRGRSIEIGFDLPIGREDSVRLSYTATMLTEDREMDGVEPSFTWHRGTVEYIRRLAGYTRQSTFDLALMVGMSLDRLNTHESSIPFDSSVRLSPWFGLESAIWENDGVGLILRMGHTLATRLTGGSASVTDLQVAVRIDLGEKSSLELGYRYVSVRFRDRHGSSGDDYSDKMDQTFRGPVVGLALRF
jgi:hypothetical protein